ncbi:MAG: 4Fe-4S binding protein [Phycisphaerales bacterium]|jgi:MinD superfamily P-loop ATPase|nr:4Fe-4S binding protein [Phycisphaerales bacterium]
MKEMVVISGKGGTGKTSLVASLAVLAGNAVLADCDVDAADLHLVLEPSIVRDEEFYGGSRARINSTICTACGKCVELCRFDAIGVDAPIDGNSAKTYRVDPIACEGCGVCQWFCSYTAVEFEPVVSGRWFVSDTRCGPLVHARLGAAEANSGKLVSLVRDEARKIAKAQGHDLVLIDGSPGIGCPVIASIGGADMVLVVTEPTLSGLHDLQRVADLTRHFGVETLLCINKWDLNEDIASYIETQAVERRIKPVGRVRYAPAVTEAQVKGLSVVEYAQNGVADDIKNLWGNVRALLNTASEE